MPKLKQSAQDQLATAIKAEMAYALAKKGWSKQHLAQLVGKSPSVISQVFNEPLKREFWLLLLVCDKLGIKIQFTTQEVTVC